MKTFLRLSLLLAAAPLMAQPALHIDTTTFAPKTTFKLAFEKAVVTQDNVGKSFPNTLLKIEPPLAGDLKWIATDAAEFVRKGVPRIDTEYTFSMLPGHLYQDGADIASGKLKSLRTVPFTYEYAYWRGTPRTPRYYVRFNDAVDPAAAASKLAFVDKEGNRVGAEARRGVFGDLSTRSAMGPTWKQQFSGWQAPQRTAVDPSYPIPSALTVTPVHPLPVGEGWKLVIGAGLPNASASASTLKPVERWIGTVRTFEVASIQAITRLDGPRYISIGLSKALPEKVDLEKLAEFISVEPAPQNLKLEAKNSVISIRGDFPGRSEWKVTIKRGFVARDGLAMNESKTETIRFKHLPPAIVAPSYAAAQLAVGSRTYNFETTNIGKARIRVKRLAGPEALRTYQGYRHYSGDGPGSERFKGRHPIPWSLVAGDPIYDKTVTLDNEHDTSRNLEIKWDEVLGGKRAHGLLFVSVEGDPKSGMENQFDKQKVNQIFLQLTDIGLAWKLNKDSAFLYAYSCDTGEPLANVQLDVFGEDAAALQTSSTNESGVANLPRTAEQRHLRASLGDDSLIVTFDSKMPTVSMWRFPVRTEWDPQLPNRRLAHLFTDRSLYRPGEEVHLKGIVRRIEQNRSVFDSTKGAELVIRDSSSRVLIEEDVTLSANGTFDYSFRLPAETVGFFSMQLHWPDEIAKAAELENWRERAAVINSASFKHNVNVQEFRRNAFEVKSQFLAAGKDTLKLELAAKYFQGQPVAEGKVEWFYRSKEAGFYPEEFRDFLFCNHRSFDAYYWSHYFGYGEGSYRNTHASKNGTATLDRDGLASIEFALENIEFPSPRTIRVTSEIRDQRNQTLSTDASTTVHSSAVYLGVSRVDRLVRVGDDFQLKAVAVNSDGQAAEQPLQATLKIEREINEQIKTKTESGTIAVRNETRLEPVEERSLTINPEDTKAGGLVVPFKPAHSGKHILTFSGTDADGKAFRTAVIYRVYGTKEFPWAYENGMLIKLVPEKKRYKPGETARVLVQSPIEGTALITLEREGVLRHMIRELKADNPVVEIPLTDDDAPNTFVSVLVIKGSRDNLREHKEPILRLGYCELSVENVRERLQIAMKIPGDYHRPGEEVVITGKVRDASGRPVNGAEVVLYAEDEGTLAVAGYENPDPLAHFYAPRSLRTEAGTSLVNVISEDPAERFTFNKGFFIGGGAGGELAGDEGPPLRKDFNPCAFWAPALMTDAEGNFKMTFNSPDTLTRYRVIAVALHGSAHFGAETSEFVVNKPLMLEPAVPRFAHEGDRLQPGVLVQNATSYNGTWKVSLKLGSITNFVEGSDRTQSKTITIPADGSATVTFDLTFANTGEVDWQWSAAPVTLDGAALNAELSKRLSDAVATNFPVEYPMPLLRETKFIRFQNPNSQRNLLEGLSPELLDGRGKLELEFGRSVLLEAGEALNFLLQYPYGCVEQTTSSTIPWIAAMHLRDVAPAFRGKTEKEIRKNIQAGANRLLSMQCDDGGLGYWPGDRDSNDWASAYGGLALILCREAGASIPESAVAGLRKFLASHLRGVPGKDDWWAMETACRACYTLALAGDPQIAYHNKLLENADKLSPNALNFLALAVAKSGAENAAETAAKILATPGSVVQRDGHFLSYHPSAAYRLLALATLQPKSKECDQAIDRLLAQRGGSGHWGTTWANAWTVYALGEYARIAEAKSAPPVINLLTDAGKRDLQLDDKNPSERISIPLHGGLKAQAAAPEGAFARVQISSKPKIAPSQAISTNGLQVLRTYHLVKADGSTEPLVQPAVGDLVKVELQVTMPRDGTRYLVVDDPLPSLFEAVNTSFASQSGRVKNQSGWRISNQELRDDRALFFMNSVPRSGTYKLSYHARVTSAGEATAPPAKVEAMYEPEFFALSSSRTFKTPNPLHTAAR